MKAPKKVLQKAVRAGVQLLADKQAAENYLWSDNTDYLMKAFDEKGMKGLVRGIFGRTCLERVTGSDDLTACDFEDAFRGTHKPVPAAYDLVLEKIVGNRMHVDLEDDMFFTYVATNLADKYEKITEKELVRAVNEVYGAESIMLAVSGVMQVYALRRRKVADPSMNGPQDREIAVEEMLFGELYVRITQIEPVADLPKAGPVITGRVLMATERTREGGGLSMWLRRAFSGDHRKDLRDMGFYLINQLCGFRNNPERFKADLLEQNLKYFKLEEPVEDYISKLNSALTEFGSDLDGACEAVSLEKSWREIDPSLPDTHPFSGLGWI